MAHRQKDLPGSVPIPTDSPIWQRCFMVAPLVLIGSREGGGAYDVAPKHMAMPLGWQNYYCFACSPLHATQHNIQSTKEFTVSFPRPDHILEASMAAGPRIEDGSKPTLAALESFPATIVDGVLVRDAYLWLECVLDRVLEGFGDNSLIIGKVIAAAADEKALRAAEAAAEGDPVRDMPLLAYLSPGRFASVEQSSPFPFHVDFHL